MAEIEGLTQTVPEAAPGRPLLRFLVALPVVLFAGLAILFAVRLTGGGDPAQLPSALIGRPVPSFDLPPLPGLADPAGTAVPGLSSARLTDGRVTVVNMWASWCAPCRVEHPVLMGIARDPSIRLVGFNYKDTPENARRFLGSLGNPFAAVGIDATGRAAIDWGVYGVPETFVVAPDGTIRYKHVGPLTAEALPGFMAEIRKAGARP